MNAATLTLTMIRKNATARTAAMASSSRPKNLPILPHQQSHRHSHRPSFLVGAAAVFLASAGGGSAFASSHPGFGSRRLNPRHNRAEKSLSSDSRFTPFKGGGGVSRRGSDATRTSSTSSFRRAPIATTSPFVRKVRKVVVVGGTHGNEYTGVWCIKAIEAQRLAFELSKSSGVKVPNAADAAAAKPGSSGYSVFEKFPSLDVDTLLGNPLAYMQNKRFVDTDINREFSAEKLRRVEGVNGNDDDEECDVRADFCSEDAEAMRQNRRLPHEAIRAREVEALLDGSTETGVSGANGGDGGDASAEPKSDVVIDLHTTTCNMGVCLIVPEGDPLMSAAAAYIAHQCRTKHGYDDVRVLMHALPRRQDRPNLSSCGRHGFTVEVGPVAQGVLRHDIVEKTQACVDAMLEFLHRRNLEIESEEGGGTNGANGSEEVSPPKSAVLDELRRIYPNHIVPCYRSAPAVRPGELSGKISWPNDPNNPNFPAVMVHKSLQDEDFRRLAVGDPLFVEPDGTVVPYDGSHGDDVRVVFVNEGGYYYASSGTGIGVAIESQFNWETGWFVADVDDDGESEDVVVEEKDSYE